VTNAGSTCCLRLAPFCSSTLTGLFSCPPWPTHDSMASIHALPDELLVHVFDLVTLYDPDR